MPVLPGVPRAGHYGVIYADPPWTFATYSDKGKGRSAEAHYDCMSIEDIAALPVSTWAADDAALFLWVTKPLLMKMNKVIQAWGFEYKTVGFTWAKTKKHHTGSVFDDADFSHRVRLLHSCQPRDVPAGDAREAASRPLKNSPRFADEV